MKILRVLSTYLLFLAFDQGTKYFVISRMSIGQSVPILEGLLYLTYVQNPGGAFGVFSQNREFLIVTSLLLMAILIFYWRNMNRYKRTGILPVVLIFSGASGNLFDRIFYGAVVDFIDLRIWPVFNLADLFIIIGLGVFFYQSLKVQKEPG